MSPHNSLKQRDNMKSVTLLLPGLFTKQDLFVFLFLRRLAKNQYILIKNAGLWARAAGQW